MQKEMQDKSVGLTSISNRQRKIWPLLWKLDIPNVEKVFK